MDDDPIRVGHQQAAADSTIKWDIGAGDNAPEPVLQNNFLTKKSADQSRPLLPVLVAPDRA
jgi:hypothetical protein